MKKELNGYGYLQKNIYGTYDLVGCETGEVLKTMPYEEALEHILVAGSFVKLEDDSPEE